MADENEKEQSEMTAPDANKPQQTRLIVRPGDLVYSGYYVDRIPAELIESIRGQITEAVTRVGDFISELLEPWRIPEEPLPAAPESINV